MMIDDRLTHRLDLLTAHALGIISTDVLKRRLLDLGNYVQGEAVAKSLADRIAGRRKGDRSRTATVIKSLLLILILIPGVALADADRDRAYEKRLSELQEQCREHWKEEAHECSSRRLPVTRAPDIWSIGSGAVNVCKEYRQNILDCSDPDTEVGSAVVEAADSWDAEQARRKR